MKKLNIILLLLIVFVINGLSQKISCKVSVHATAYPKTEILLVWIEAGEYERRDISLNAGKGEVTVEVPRLTSLMLMTMDESKRISLSRGIVPAPAIQFFAEEEGVCISFDNNTWPVSTLAGGKVNNDYMLLWEKTGPLSMQENKLLRQIHGTTSPADSLRFRQELQEVRIETEKNKREFIAGHPESYISLYLLKDQFSQYSLADFESKFLALSPELRASELGKTVTSRIENARQAAPGQPAPQFTKKDKDGKAVSLSDYKGHYVLLDFWGSWCGPCRNSHPHLIELHKKYAPRGMVFINIAQEGNSDPRASWLKAIEEDQLSWTQLLNDEDQKTYDLVKLYAIQGFPTKILIDPEGRILERYLGGGNEIDSKLQELFPE